MKTIFFVLSAMVLSLCLYGCGENTKPQQHTEHIQQQEEPSKSEKQIKFEADIKNRQETFNKGMKEAKRKQEEIRNHIATHQESANNRP